MVFRYYVMVPPRYTVILHGPPLINLPLLRPALVESLNNNDK
jgi:hypothetical protein